MFHVPGSWYWILGTPKIAIAVGSFSGAKASASILCEVDH
jgi:hypothetical protein